MLQHIRYLVLQHEKFLSGHICLKNKFEEKALPVLEGCLPYRLLVHIYEEKSSWKTQVSFLWQNSSWVHEDSPFFFVLLFFMKSRKKIINPTLLTRHSFIRLDWFLWENIQGVASNLFAKNVIHDNV